MTAARTLKLVPLALATALLAGGAWLAQSALKQLAFERQESAQMYQRLDNARRLMPEVEQRERLLKSLDNVQAQVTRLGFDPARWGERRLRRAQGPATRVEVSDFLAELARGGAGAIFVADNFELASVSDGAGLFQTPHLDDKGMTLSASGTLYFQTAGTGAAPQPRTLP